jgi:hypothetical protein
MISNTKTNGSKVTRAALLVLLSIAALLAATSSSAFASSSGEINKHPHGTPLGIVKPHGKPTNPDTETGPPGHGSKDGSTPTVGTGIPGNPNTYPGNLTYHNGAVMHTNRTHAIYWVPSGYSISSNYRSVMDRFLSDAAAASGQHTNVYSTTTQYYDNTNGNILNQSTFAGSIMDTNPFPGKLSDCVDSIAQACLTDAQIQKEIDRVITANNLPRGLNEVYFLFTPQNVGSCFGSTWGQWSSECAYTDYCAYHWWFPSNGSAVLYANQPYAAQRGCTTGQTPNASDADATISVVSHEHKEAITDPQGTGWTDAHGAENSDKCAWVFGNPLGQTRAGDAHSYYNQVINGNKYYMQLDWSNADSGANQDLGCVPSYGSDTVAPVVTTAPTQRVVPNSVLGTTTVRASITWAGSDANGIASYSLWKSTDGGSYTKETLTSATATQQVLSLTAGHSYKFAVKATDTAGNVSDWKYSPTFTPDLRDGSNTAIAYSGSWSVQSSTNYFGGTTKYTSTNGNKATMTFTGRNVAWAATLGASAGQADVLIDGVKVAAISQNRATTSYRTVAFAKSVPYGTHTISIQRNSANTGYIDIDALVVLR